jgi:hypothetical protein
MAAREFHGIIYNMWDKPLYWSNDDCDSGQWQDPWYPSKVPGAGRIDPQQHGEWRSESDAFITGTGTSGWARWAVKVLEVSEGVEHVEYVQVNWSIPFWQFTITKDLKVGNTVNISCRVSRTNPAPPKDDSTPPDPRPPILALVPWRPKADGTLALPTGEDDRGLGLIHQAGTLFSTFFFPNFVVVEHAIVPFTLRRAPSSQVAAPLVPATPKGIVYAVTPVVPATLPTGIGPGLGGHPASGGDLMWARHIGREDGSFNWEGPKTVGTGWSGFEHVFSGGDGIIYGIDPIVEARVHLTGGTTPASGGNLWWYRHVGSADGSFKWEGPKKVGTGWGGLEHVFTGGDGIIYFITRSVPASLPTGIGPGMGGQPASGGDLMWAHHIGRDDGTFKWEGPKKVGTGWGGLEHVFSGGDGIIYAITPIVEASLPIGIGPGMGGHPMSGGDLMWAHHIGRDNGSFKWEGPLKKVGTGWGRLNHVFSGGGGIVYAITPFVPASLPTGIGPRFSGKPASGGDLMWARHTGRANGSFSWDGPLKRVGTGWRELLQLFSGD